MTVTPGRDVTRITIPVAALARIVHCLRFFFNSRQVANLKRANCINFGVFCSAVWLHVHSTQERRENMGSNVDQSIQNGGRALPTRK